jgi:hypothetical protein
MQRIDKQPPRRRNWMPVLVCGCLAALAFGMVLVGAIVLLVVVPLLPGLALQSAGFTPRGSTAQVFANVPPVPTIQLQNPVAPTQAVISLGSLGTQELSQSQDSAIALGTTGDGSAATVSFTEDGLMNLCRQRSEICSNANDQFRNANIDLRPGGAIIYADVFIKQYSLWQPIGVVLHLDSSRQQFVVSGVDVNGTLYGLPSGDLGDSVAQVAAKGNDLLRQLTLEAGGGHYSLSEVLIDDTTLTLVMR